MSPGRFEPLECNYHLCRKEQRTLNLKRSFFPCLSRAQSVRTAIVLCHWGSGEGSTSCSILSHWSKWHWPWSQFCHWPIEPNV
jgi:hypothetical protein